MQTENSQFQGQSQNNLSNLLNFKPSLCQNQQKFSTNKEILLTILEKINEFETYMKDNMLEMLEQVLVSIDNLIRNFQFINYTEQEQQINYYILNQIFLEYYNFENFTFYTQNLQRFQYEEIKNQVMCTQYNFTVYVFKIVAYLELKNQQQIALTQFLNPHLEFLFENDLIQEALLLILFTIDFVEHNNLENIDLQYYWNLVEQADQKVHLDNEIKQQLMKNIKLKYLFITKIFLVFDNKTTLQFYDYKKLFKNHFDNLPQELQKQTSTFQNYKLLCFIFDDIQKNQNQNQTQQSQFSNISEIKKQNYNPITKSYLEKANFLNDYNYQVKVLKFNSTSSGYHFRYLICRKAYIALLPQSKKNKQIQSSTQRGVYDNQLLRGVVFGVINNKQISYKKKFLKHNNEFYIPQFSNGDDLLRYHAIYPIYTINLIYKKRIITLAFSTFSEIKHLFSTYFLPLKEMAQKQKRKLYVTSMGQVLWRKFKFYIWWKLGRRNNSEVLGEKNKLSFTKLINLGREYQIL